MMTRHFTFIGFIGLLIVLSNATTDTTVFEEKIDEKSGSLFGTNKYPALFVNGNEISDEEVGDVMCPAEYSIHCNYSMSLYGENHFCVSDKDLTLQNKNGPNVVRFVEIFPQKPMEKTTSDAFCQMLQKDALMDTATFKGLVTALNLPEVEKVEQKVYCKSTYETKGKKETKYSVLSDEKIPKKYYSKAKKALKLFGKKTNIKFKNKTVRSIQCFGVSTWWQRNYVWIILLVVGVIVGVGSWYFFYRDQNDDDESNNDENKAKSDP